MTASDVDLLDEGHVDLAGKPGEDKSVRPRHQQHTSQQEHPLVDKPPGQPAPPRLLAPTGALWGQGRAIPLTIMPCGGTQAHHQALAVTRDGELLPIPTTVCQNINIL